MSCSPRSRLYPTNRVFPRSAPHINEELLQGIAVHHALNRCSDPSELSKHLNKITTDNATIAYRNNENDSYKYSLPVGDKKIPDFIASPQCGVKKSNNRLSLDEVDLIIRKELSENRRTIKDLFHGDKHFDYGNVTKGKLLRILATLCPLISVEIFHRLLERYGLDKRVLISFRQFEEAFTAQPLGKHSPPTLFGGLGADRCVSVAQAFKMLQEIACDPSFNLKLVLPPSCFEPGGRVLCPQLREAMKMMRIKLTDENYRRFWRDKIDLERVGSVRTSQLCKLMNLREDGTPLGTSIKVRPLEAANLVKVPKLTKAQLLERLQWPPFEMLPPHTRGSSGEAVTLIHEPPVAGGIGFPIPEQHSWTPQGPGGASEPVFGCGDRFKQQLNKLEVHHPRFGDVIACLRYKFENPYQALLVSFKHFDKKHNNCVTETDCLNVLREYGLHVTSDNLSGLLRRTLSSSEATGFSVGRDKPPETTDPHHANIRPGLIPYRRMLAFYQNRCKGGPAYQLIQEYLERTSSSVDGRSRANLSPDEIEEELVVLLHKTYIEFIRKLRCEHTAPQRISEHAFRSVVNAAIGFTMDESQWEHFKKFIPYAEPQVVNYEQFLNLFNHPTGVSMSHRTAAFHCPRQDCLSKSNDVRGGIRDKPTLLRLVEQTIRTRLHHIDKNYKHYDHEYENMLSKKEFGELLIGQGLDLTQEELDYLWGLLNCAEANKEFCNYRQVMKFFYNNTRPILAEMMRLRHNARNQSLHDANIERLRSWRKELKDRRKVYEDSLLKGGRLAASITPRDEPLEKPSGNRISHLCNKIAERVQQHWEEIQKAFVDNDLSGTAEVLWSNFIEIAQRFNFPLTDRELTELCLHFNSKGKDYFNYLKFMKHFAKVIPGEIVSLTKYDERTYRFTNLKTGERLAFAEVLHALLKACRSQWRTLKEAFRKLDSKHRGILTVEQIDAFLKKQGIHFGEGDLYHLYSSFDSNMHGYIDFNEFKRTLLKTYKPVA